MPTWTTRTTRAAARKSSSDHLGIRTMPWIDYEALSRSKRVLLWAAVAAVAVAVATLLWFLGFRSTDVPAVQ